MSWSSRWSLRSRRTRITLKYIFNYPEVSVRNSQHNANKCCILMFAATIQYYFIMDIRVNCLLITAMIQQTLKENIPEQISYYKHKYNSVTPLSTEVCYFHSNMTTHIRNVQWDHTLEIHWPSICIFVCFLTQSIFLVLGCRNLFSEHSFII